MHAVDAISGRLLWRHDPEVAKVAGRKLRITWGPRGIGYYVGARLLWNVEEDPKALVADFYQKAFGPAAQ